MKPQLTTVLLLLLTILSSPLLAQPALTLSGDNFYVGDAPGTFSVACPPGTTAGISPLTKVANVPLLNPAENQYDLNIPFPWRNPSGTSNILTGTLPQSTTQVVMGGFLIYNVGVLAGTAFCNAPLAVNSTSTSFTITLAGTTRADAGQVQARVGYALKAYSVKLPQLATTEQTTLPTQQAGNLVYNTDQKQLAVYNGTNWQYLATAGTGQFQNERAFTAPGTFTWTVPAGVTRVFAEVWGGGAGAPYYNHRDVTQFGSGASTAFVTRGGAAGGYARGIMPVTPGSALTLVVGSGGMGMDRSDIYRGVPEMGGTDSSIRRNANGAGLWASAATYFNAVGSGSGTDLSFGAAGSSPTEGTVSYGSRSATEYMMLIKFGNGGTAYGVQSGIAGIGSQGAVLNSVTVSFTLGDGAYVQNGSFPGGGGGGGYNIGGAGGNGMIMLRW